MNSCDGIERTPADTCDCSRLDYSHEKNEGKLIRESLAQTSYGSWVCICSIAENIKEIRERTFQNVGWLGRKLKRVRKVSPQQFDAGTYYFLVICRLNHKCIVCIL